MILIQVYFRLLKNLENMILIPKLPSTLILKVDSKEYINAFRMSYLYF